jgi:hypothetical protein
MRLRLPRGSIKSCDDTRSGWIHASLCAHTPSPIRERLRCQMCAAPMHVRVPPSHKSHEISHLGRAQPRLADRHHVGLIPLLAGNALRHPHPLADAKRHAGQLRRIGDHRRLVVCTRQHTMSIAIALAQRAPHLHHWSCRPHWTIRRQPIETTMQTTRRKILLPGVDDDDDDDDDEEEAAAAVAVASAPILHCRRSPPPRRRRWPTEASAIGMLWGRTAPEAPAAEL